MNALGSNEVRIYTVLDDGTPLPEWQGLLAPDELARHERIVPPHTKREYLLTRLLCRRLLGRMLDRDPATLAFVSGERGRPELVGRELRFNLSNTYGMVALAITQERDVGVDVEDKHRRSDTIGIADRFFAPSEVQELLALPAAQQQSRFFDYWTLKEAYIKARGLGLAIPLEDFAFVLGGPEIGIRFSAALADTPGRWQFWQSQPTARHALAAAATHVQGERLALTLVSVPITALG